MKRFLVVGVLAVAAVALIAAVAIDDEPARRAERDPPAAPASPSGSQPRKCGVHLDATDDLQAALEASPAGSRICLAPGATYETNVPIVPRAGQTLIGPASVMGTEFDRDQDVFELKTSGDDGVEDVTFIDLTITGAGRHGVGCWIGTVVIGGRIHGNGKDGVGCDLEGHGPVLVAGVEIDGNGIDPEWKGNTAGIKWFHANDVTIRDSHVHDNLGNGVWCDAQCGDVTVTNNVIERNELRGVFYEKGGGSDTDGAFYEGMLVVTENVIRSNDREDQDQANSGVAIESSKNALVAHNSFGGHGRAVTARQSEERLTDDRRGWPLENVIIRQNELNGDQVVGCSSPGVTCSSNG